MEAYHVRILFPPTKFPTPPPRLLAARKRNRTAMATRNLVTRMCTPAASSLRRRLDSRFISSFRRQVQQQRSSNGVSKEFANEMAYLSEELTKVALSLSQRDRDLEKFIKGEGWRLIKIFSASIATMFSVGLYCAHERRRSK
ncbi:hypothetical protein BS78_K324500 [Paspalum vaginatum]|uniref:Uncharacterized protein n=1 Tax=Paspalum vaginatum TaxID=158149 RepID=A0A9W7XA46_9POAL|nr:hypothetical protein BS78_K324500 [Paspalum vaginatum]KAJ1254791.1 hypothetical protein BS78_K324500 [Paspalum vaginatum]